MENATDYLEFKVKPNRQYNFYADVVSHLKQISLYTDNLFSLKNILSEITLQYKDFNYLPITRYHVPKQHTLKMEGKSFAVDREKNILFTKVYYEDLLGKGLD